MRIATHFTWKRTLLIGLSLAALATLVISRNTQVHANNLTNTPLQSCVWKETELGWNGGWVRERIDEKEGTQIFNAVWEKRGQKEVKAVLEIKFSGNAVSILRKNEGGKEAGTCNYTGTLSEDRKTVSGTYSCSGSAQKYDWSATINEDCF